MVRVTRRIGVALWVAGFALLPAGGAQAEDPQGWAYQIAHELMSPFCPGRTLHDCSSGQADTLRSWIIVQAAAGRTRADVEAELFERYGDVLRAAPKAEGFGAAAYVFPLLAFIGGGVFVAVFLRRQIAAGRDEPPPEPAPVPRDPELERIIDRELAG